MRILYFSDVPVKDQSYAGPVILYRLLSSLSGVQTKVVTTRMFQVKGLDPNFECDEFDYPLYRLRNSRYSAFYSLFMILLGPLIFQRFKKMLNDFRPDIVLTVSHGYAFFTAAYYAKRMNIPYAIIHHDEYLMTFLAPTWARSWIDRKFSKIYQFARCNFVVSPSLAGHYEKLYRGRSMVLFPGRSGGLVVGKERQAGIPRNELSFAYFGSINSRHWLKDFIKFVSSFDESFQFHLIGNMTPAQLDAEGVVANNIHCHGWLDWMDLECLVNDQIDALMVLQESDVTFAHAVEVNFPSKLVEYTRFGKPIVCVAPPYASSADFARQHPDAFIWINSDSSKSEILKSIQPLMNGALRREMGSKANELGIKLFDAVSVRSVFLEGIQVDNSRSN